MYIGIAMLLSDIREFSTEGVNMKQGRFHFAKNKTSWKYPSFMNLHGDIIVNLNICRKKLKELQGVMGYVIITGWKLSTF